MPFRSLVRSKKAFFLETKVKRIFDFLWHLNIHPWYINMEMSSFLPPHFKWSGHSLSVFYWQEKVFLDRERWKVRWRWQTTEFVNMLTVCYWPQTTLNIICYIVCPAKRSPVKYLHEGKDFKNLCFSVFGTLLCNKIHDNHLRYWTHFSE